MTVTSLFRSLAMALLLPAVGVAVAAAAAARPSEDATVTKESIESLPAPVIADGRQDASQFSHVVRLTESGQLVGTVSQVGGVVADLPVRIMQRGQLIATTSTDSSGRFVVDGLQPGVYSLFGQNESSMIAFGFYVVGNGVEADAVSSLDSMATSTVDMTEINRIRRNYLPTVMLLPEEETNANAYAKAMRQSFLVSSSTSTVDMVQVAAESRGKTPALPLQHRTVTLIDGQLDGHLSQIFGSPIDFRAIHCFLVSKGAVVAEVPANADGSFEFTGVAPGSYSFVAAGTGGFATLSLELIGDATASLSDGTQFVSTNSSLVSSLAVALVAQEDAAGGAPAATGSDDDDDGGAIFMGDGGFGGGFGGGGGGGGGIGGIGGLALIGLGAAAIAIAAADDDEEPASPNNP